jgi:phosphoribosylaminoimidazolecarboxamide formyltransferase / IMP cyclohydrolase
MVKKRTEAPTKFALLSVSDKFGIVSFAKVLTSLGYAIISTGGTAKELTKHDIAVIPIQQITGNPESFDGRMKTISFQIESGILFDRDNPQHRKEAKTLKITPIDIVVCNLYPFEETVKKKGVALKEAIESIDVGGPTMVRAAAKNFKDVIVVVSPNDYDVVGQALQKGMVEESLRRELAAKAFSHLSFYDAQIASFLRLENYPAEFVLAGRKLLDLRYGENPHQSAAVYVTPGGQSPFSHLHKLWGRDLSLTNLTDINAGIETVRIFQEATASVIKHNNPCGIALGETPKQALQRAIQADPESAFGGVIVLNKNVDIETAEIIGSFKEERHGNIDILAAPEIDTQALGYLLQLRKSMGIYVFSHTPDVEKKRTDMKWIDGGFILQERDDFIEQGFMDWKVVTRKNLLQNNSIRCSLHGNLSLESVQMQSLSLIRNYR